VIRFEFPLSDSRHLITAIRHPTSDFRQPIYDSHLSHSIQEDTDECGT
jgi:hypothetical protein